MSSVERLVHPLAPWVGPESQVLILGSFPSPKSRAYGMYYGHPQNRFWKILEAVFAQEVPADAEGRKAFILAHGLALWDTVLEADLVGASDAKMRVVRTADLAPLLAQAPIRKIYATGRLATDLFRRYLASDLGMEAQYLPSTSPANQAHWPLPKLIDAYRVLKEDVSLGRDLPGGQR